MTTSLDRDALLIGTQWRSPATDDVIEVVSPHTEEVVARVPEGSVADMDAAVAVCDRLQSAFNFCACHSFNSLTGPAAQCGAEGSNI